MTSVQKPARGDRAPGYSKADLDSMKFGEPFTPVKVWRHELVGSAKDAAGCLEIIGSQWDLREYDGKAHTGHYEFEMDDHLFRVSITPFPRGDGDS